MHSTTLTPANCQHTTRDFSPVAQVTKRSMLRAFVLSTAAMLGFAVVLGAFLVTPQQIEELRHPWSVSIQELAIDGNERVQFALCRSVSKSFDTRVRRHLSRQASNQSRLDPEVVTELVNSPSQACALRDGMIVVFDDGTLQRFDSRSPAPTVIGRHSESRAWKLSHSADDRFLLAWRNRCSVWDLAENKLLAEFSCNFAFAVPSNTGRSFFCDQGDNLVECDLLTGALLRVIAPIGQVQSATLSADERYHVSVGLDRKLQVVDVENSVSLWKQTIGEHQSGNLAAVPLFAPVLTFNPDGQRCLCAYQLRPGHFGVGIWDIRSGKPQHTFDAHTARIVGMQFSSARRLYTWGADCRLCQWELDDSGARLMTEWDTANWRTLE